jgi:hypothetical protein
MENEKTDKASVTPSLNPFGMGVKERDVFEAIKRSGYPLQTVIASQLRETFAVQEEWSYIDGDTQEQRTIDIRAWRDLYDINNNQSQPRIRPTLNLLIECKQSNLPYVFFLSHSRPWLPEFPSMAGLSKDEITITSDDDPSIWSFQVLHVLGLDSHEFLSSPPYSSTFSKCVRKGSELELSGAESYNGLILPILKSVLHFQAAEVPPKTAIYFDAHLVIGVGVLDAPMIGVTIENDTISLKPIQWVRVTRHESLEGEHRSERTKLRAIDIVHKDFLNAYLTQHVAKFADDFAKLALKHQVVIADCEAFVSGMGQDSWHKIESRLKKKNLSANMSRIKSVGRNVIKLFKKKNP